MARRKRRLQALPDILPTHGHLTHTVLFADFEKRLPTTTPEQWNAECSILIRHGLAGVALRIFRQHSLQVAPDVIRRLEIAHFEQVTATFHMIRHTHAGLDGLRSANIPFVVAKGPGIAQVCQPISERTYSDIDVIVKPSHFSHALELLQRLGYAERSESIQPWPSHRRLGREATNLRTEAGGSIDLHHRISPWNWSTALTFEELHSRASDVDLDGLSLPVISTDDNLLVAALHVVSDKSHPGQSLRVWRDLLVLARATTPDVVTGLATQSGMSAWLKWILLCLPENARPAELLRRLDNEAGRVPHALRLQLLLHTKSEHLLNPMYRIPVPNAIFTVCGSLLPSRSYLRVEYPETDHGYLTRWRNLLSRLPPALGKTSRRPKLQVQKATTQALPVANGLAVVPTRIQTDP